jgi:hypothetical protein
MNAESIKIKKINHKNKSPFVFPANFHTPVDIIPNFRICMLDVTCQKSFVFCKEIVACCCCCCCCCASLDLYIYSMSMCCLLACMGHRHS